MPIHTVRRGDSLWGLANRYLGDGAKWPATTWSW
jgi:nucleoid-associated protein YgaU